MIWMQHALMLAKQGRFTARPNPLVGCVLVKDNQIVGEGLHWKSGEKHAEINALLQAKDKARGATCYVTLEPCGHTGKTAPCVEALIEAGVKEVIIATRDPNPLVNGKGIALLKDAGMTVTEGVMEEEARALNKGFFSRMLHKRPYVRAKIAMSLDARTAMKSGESQWITSEASRLDAHHYRAQSGAILTSAKTVLRDNCKLTVRGVEMDLPENVTFDSPLRVVIDTKQSLSNEALIFKQEGKTCVAVSEEKVKYENDNVFTFPEIDEHVDLKSVLAWLANSEINDVWVEAGPTLVGAMLNAKLIDECIIYIAPKWLGHEALPMVNLPGFETLASHIPGHFSDVKQIGSDLRLIVQMNDPRGEHDS